MAAWAGLPALAASQDLKMPLRVGLVSMGLKAYVLFMSISQALVELPKYKLW